MVLRIKIIVGWGEERTPTESSISIVGVHKFTPTYELFILEFLAQPIVLVIIHSTGVEKYADLTVL
jgi:hypothetical protein